MYRMKSQSAACEMLTVELLHIFSKVDNVREGRVLLARVMNNLTIEYVKGMHVIHLQPTTIS